MIFSEEFVSSVKADPIRGAIQIVKTAQEHLVDAEEWSDTEYDVLMEAYALMTELIDSGLLPIQRTAFDMTGDKTKDCVIINRTLKEIGNVCEEQAAKLKLASLKSHFKTALGSGFYYELSQGDLERVQTLLNEIRDLIAASTIFQADHKQRLLRRLEKLQSELHKKVSDLDRFWGLIGDAGVVLGKLGNDAKPIVDRIREIAAIVWRTQSRAEELPSGTPLPMLENKSDQGNEQC